MTTTTGIPQYQHRPGSAESGAINLSTGDLAFPVSLVSLPGRNGLTYDLAIQYTSASIPTAVTTWNAEAPTGPLGLGWTLPSEKIVRDSKGTGTREDDTYYFCSGSALSPLHYTDTDEEGEIYVLGASPFWKIRYQPKYELWIVIKEDGTQFLYGGNQQSPTSDSQAVELTVKWGNWMGLSISGGQHNLAIVWNLAAIQHPIGDQIRLRYEQTLQTIGTIGNDRCTYTVACRLKQAVGATGEQLKFSYGEKHPNEYQREHTAVGQATPVRQIRGMFTASGVGTWDIGSPPDPRLTLTVTGAGGFAIPLSLNQDDTSSFPFSFDLPANTPPILTIKVHAEDYDPLKSNELMLDHTFTDVVANSGTHFIRQELQAGCFAAVALDYINGMSQTGPEAYQDHLDMTYLDSIDVLSEDGTRTTQITFDYRFLGEGPMQKRLLTAITHYAGTNDSYVPAHVFTYYGEKSPEHPTGDGVSVSRSDQSHIYDADTMVLYGALKTRTLPEGATYTYRYAKLNIPTAQRDLQILRPENGSSTWTSPRTFFGPDYVVILWTGKDANQGKIFISAYQWSGRWLAADLGAFETSLSSDRPSQAELGPTFFAVMTPGQNSSVHLFSKDTRNPGKWNTYSPTTGAISTYQTALGTHYYAVLDQASGHLYRYVQEGISWRADEKPEHLKTGSTTAVFGLAGRNNVLFAVSADPANSYTPELSLFWLTRARTWEKRTWSVDPYCPAKDTSHASFDESGIKSLVVQISDTFVALQSCHHTAQIVTGGRTSSDYYRHFVYRWDETYQIIEQRELGSEIQVDTESESGLSRLTVVGSQIHLDTVTQGLAGGTLQATKEVYQFLGTGWDKKSFETDSLRNSFFGFNSFSVTKHGFAQYHQWNPGLLQWEAPSTLLSYKDSNPTFLEKIWAGFMLIEGFLTMLLPGGEAIDMFFTVLDAVISHIVAPGTGGQQSGRYFTANNIVYYRNPDSTWTRLEELAKEYQERLLPSPFGQTLKESLKFLYQCTQTAATFVTFGVEINHTKIIHDGSNDPPILPVPGYPKTISRVQLLKNGQFFGPAIDLPEGESLKRSDVDGGAELIGPEAFLTYSGSDKLAGATRLHLYRVVQDAIQGPLHTYVVGSEQLDEGYTPETYTHYAYETAEVHPSGGTAFFNKVTTVYSGAATVAPPIHGYLETYFYNGSTAALPYAPPSNMKSAPLHAIGLRYHSRIYAWKGQWGKDPLGTTTEWWQFFSAPLSRGESSLYARPVKQEAVIEALTRVTDIEYAPEAHGFPTRITVTNSTLSGDTEQIVTTHRYACQDYPDLARQNILNAVSLQEQVVNGKRTEATATLWQQFAPVAPMQAGLSYPKWASSATYCARSASSDQFDPAAIDPIRWLKTTAVSARDPKTGVVTEQENSDGVVQATIYDLGFRFPVASFTHASVANGEAGYYGFEAYEDAAPWEVTGNVEPQQLGPHRAFLFGKTATVRPKRFQPRAADVPYLISAWVRATPGGGGASLGFGERKRTFPPPENGPEWQYVEYGVPSTTDAQKPIVTCDGAIDDVRFGPVDAPFSATIYHPSYHYVTARLGTNGETSRYCYNAHHEVYAKLGTGERLQSLQWHTYSRSSTGTWQPLRPNQTLTVAARGGGQCLATRLALRDPFQVLDVNHTIPGQTPDSSRSDQSNWGIHLTVVRPHHNLLNEDRPPDPLQIQVGRIQILLTTHGYELNDNGTVHPYPAPAGSSLMDWVADPTAANWDWMVLAIGTRLLFWVNQQLVFCQQVRAIQGPVALIPQGKASGKVLEVEDVFAWRDPLVSLVYRDGLGREIQAQHLDDQAVGEIMTQTLYDGWGHPAVQTLPMKSPSVTLRYQPEVVTAYDWTSGVMAGAVVDFYTKAGQSEDFVQIVESLPQDSQFAYRRQLAEANPLARIIEHGGPGFAQRVGGNQSLRTDYGLTPEAQTLLTELGLPHGSAFSTTTTSLPYAGGSVPEVRIVDRQGQQIALRRSRGAQAQTVGVENKRDDEGLTVTTYPPSAYTTSGAPTPTPGKREQYASRDHFDYGGHLTEHRDADTGKYELVYDPAGRLRFRQDASSAAAKPPRLQYWKYDSMGRRVEAGILYQPWNRVELQQYADHQPAWPEIPTGRAPSWSMSGGNSRRTGLARARGAAREVASWNHTFSDVPSAPSVDAAGTVYLASAQNVYALAADGMLKWTFPVEGRFYQVTPAIGVDGTVYMGTLGGAFLALTPAGKLKWKVDYPPGFVWSPVVGDDGTLYVGNALGGVCAISPWQQKLLWEVHLPGRLSGPPAVGPGGRIYSAHLATNSWVVALNSYGVQQWNYPTLAPPVPESIFEGTSPVVGADGTLYLGLAQSTLLALHADGTPFWEFKDPEAQGRYYPPAIGPNGILYLGTTGGQVLAVTQAGTRQWMYQTGDAIQAAPTIGADGVIYIPSSDGTLYALTLDGQLKWKAATVGQNACSPAIGADGTLYVCNGGSPMSSASLYAFGPTAPAGYWTTRWRYDADHAGECTNRKGRLCEITAQHNDPTNPYAVGDLVVESYQYDLDGNTTAVTLQVEAFDGTPRTIGYHYNAAGQVVEVRYPPAAVRGEQPSPAAPPGALAVVRYRYDTLGRLVAIGTAEAPDRFAFYAYAFNGTLKAEWLNKRTVVGTYQYDLQGNLLKIAYRTAAAPLFIEVLGYTDANGHSTGGLVAQEVAHTVEKAPFAYRYSYDALGRLASARTLALLDQGIKARPEWDVTGPGDAPIPYDANGNMQALRMVGRTHTFTYDTGTNRLAARTTDGHAPEPFSHTPNGQVNAGLHVRQIDYDLVLGLPVKGDIQGSSPVGFLYSGGGRRVLKTQGTSPGEQVSRLYIHGESSYPLAELTNQQEARFHIYGPGGLVAIWADGKPTFVVKDHLGSTRVLLDEDRKVLGSYNYLPFGVLMPDNSSPVRLDLCRYLYTGQELDPETGFYNYRARWYVPYLGRFLTPDPAGEFFSPYLYVGNNPINYFDPTGLAAINLFRFALGSVITLGYAGIGAALGAAIGSLGGREGAGWGALGGALFGATLGIMRSVAEFALLPAIRNARAEAALARGEHFPVVAYNREQLTSHWESGRLGAEMIAEAQGIPRSLWDTHLVAFQDLRKGRIGIPGGVTPPARPNGRVIVVAHGSASGHTIEVGPRTNLTGDDFLQLFRRNNSLDPFFAAAPTYDFLPHLGPGGKINQMDFCVCRPARGFTRHFQAAQKMLGVPEFSGWASSYGTTPVGAGRFMGEIRANTSRGAEAGSWLWPTFAGGEVMPGTQAVVGQRQAIGAWTTY